MRKIQPFLMSCIFLICAFISFDTINAAEINNSFTSQQISLTGDVTSTFNPAAYTYSATTPKLTAFWDNNNKYHVAYKAIVNYEELDYIIIQRYNDKLSLEKTLKITKDLPLYGNLICDGSYYYVVFGKTDTDSVGTTPVICVSKYDLDGNKVGSCSMTGYDSSPYDDEAYWGTKIPFKAGSCKLAIQGDVLVCNYARQMYSGHQSNYVFYIDKSTMKRNTDIPVAYTSHSFDQAVLPTWDGGYLFANHGDAFERGFDIDYISPNGRRRKITSFHFREGSNRPYGYNETYAQLGGLVETSKGYVLCGSSEKTLSYDTAPTNTKYCGHSEARNLFVQVLKKDFYNYSGAQMYAVSGETRTATGKAPEDAQTELWLDADTVDYGVKWLTNYGPEYYVNNPKIVSSDDDRIIIMWEKLSYSTHTGTTYYAIYDANMNVIQSEKELPNTYLPGNSELSLNNNKIYWTTSDDYGKYIRCLDISDGSVQLDQQWAKVRGYSLSLDGDIVLNTYIELSDELKANHGTCASMNSGKEFKEILAGIQPDSNGYYKISIPIAAAQMSNSIRIKVECNGYTYIDTSYSLAEYAKYILENSTINSEFKKAEPLIRSMLNYGIYAQKYFNYNTNLLENISIYTPDNDPVLTQKIDFSDLNTYELMYDSKTECGGLKYAGASLNCESNTTLNLYFDYCGGETYDSITNNSYIYVDSYDDYDFINYSVKDVDNRFVISIKDISSLNLSSIYYIGVYNYDKDEEIYFCYSPMFYIAKAIESEDKDLANLCKAMYFYNMAAKEY